jgi:hypothetical protein
MTDIPACIEFVRRMLPADSLEPNSIPFHVVRQLYKTPGIVFYRAKLQLDRGFCLRNPDGYGEAMLNRVQAVGVQGRTFFVCTNYGGWLRHDLLAGEGYVCFPLPLGHVVTRRAELGSEPLEVSSFLDGHSLKMVPVWTWGREGWLVDCDRLPAPPTRPPSHFWASSGPEEGVLVELASGGTRRGPLLHVLGRHNFERARTKSSKFAPAEWYERYLPRYLQQHREVEP